MAVGFGVLHLAPSAFWSMTVPEFESAIRGLVGDGTSTAPLTRPELEDLMQRFPD